jgi:hypothetical protein
MLNGYLAQGGRCRTTGIREHDIEPAFLPLDLGEEPIEIAEVQRVPLYAGNISSDLLHRRGQLPITASRHEDVGAFVDELLRRRQADAAIAAGDESDFSFKLGHVFLAHECIPTERRPMLPRSGCRFDGEGDALAAADAQRDDPTSEPIAAHRVNEAGR